MKPFARTLLWTVLSLTLLISTAATDTNTQQDIRIFTVENSGGKITGKSIEKAFEAAGFLIDGNNDMNKPFKARFGATHYPVYRLATIHDPDLSAKLIAVNPLMGLLTPLSMSIWQDNEGSMNISVLSLRGLSRMTQIPMNNPDLVALAAKMEKALRAALPGGHFKSLAYQKVADPATPLSVTFKAVFEAPKDGSVLDAKDDFEAEFEGEMEPIGFLFPGFIDVNEELQERDDDSYDFYDTYSVCKLDVIFPIHQTHPEVGAFAPCTFFLYKKHGEKTVHMGFPSVQNWIASTDIADKTSLDPLIEAENLFIDTVNGITE
ncbi:DUF302 domain-containing protein [Sulfurimonas sp. HSL-3221]|uniref:DUF302 domain-containing protein n=1 Tax=Sulfurimonadaceae TaxID=2771471 RepID=UPI001E5A57F5|nr:DUF302 domain-containing protein [Sulfurimonas sp. HSL-3221]UFS62466.1 DUF302 domain-containing protein [Sulfurimonas sp. HSL-3221]